VGDQRSQDRRQFGLLLRFLFFDLEPFFDERCVKAAGHEAVAVQQTLVEGDVGIDTHHPVFAERAAHPQDGFAA